MFSSPIFGDMFLLGTWAIAEFEDGEIVFVSYIRRYVLTHRCSSKEVPDSCWFSSPIFGDMFLLLFDQLVDISTIIDIFNGTLNGQ